MKEVKREESKKIFPVWRSWLAANLMSWLWIFAGFLVWGIFEPKVLTGYESFSILILVLVTIGGAIIICITTVLFLILKKTKKAYYIRYILILYAIFGGYFWLRFTTTDRSTGGYGNPTTGSNILSIIFFAAVIYGIKIWLETRDHTKYYPLLEDKKD